MQSPSVTELLQAWERGLAQPGYERALILLAAAMPDHPPQDLAEWSMGRRDASLLQLREALFGTRLVSVTNCSRCRARLELEFATTDIRASFTQDKELETRFAAVDGDYVIRFRLPNSSDLRALAILPDRDQLLWRCVLESKHNQQPCSTESLSPEVRAEIIRQMEAADPQANVQLVLRCVECENEWPAAFDILSFLWEEIDRWALRMLREVHVLASAYGWREAEILALSPQRRQRYLEMVTA